MKLVAVSPRCFTPDVPERTEGIVDPMFETRFFSNTVFQEHEE